MRTLTIMINSSSNHDQILRMTIIAAIAIFHHANHNLNPKLNINQKR